MAYRRIYIPAGPVRQLPQIEKAQLPAKIKQLGVFSILSKCWAGAAYGACQFSVIMANFNRMSLASA